MRAGLTSTVLALLEGVRFLWAIRRRGWWRRPPFLPVPSRAYLDWRLGTVYGTGNEEAAREDWPNVRRFLLWRRALRLTSRR